jgi:hypothetical protein
LAVSINKQQIFSFISHLEMFVWLITEPDNIQFCTWLTQNSLLPNPFRHIILNRHLSRLIIHKCLIWHTALNNLKKDRIFLSHYSRFVIPNQSTSTVYLAH